MLHRDNRRPSEKSAGTGSGSSRRRKARVSVESLEERSLLSTASGLALNPAHAAFLAAQAHRLQVRSALLAQLHQATGSTQHNVSASAVSANLVKPTPKAAAGALTVQWTYPNSGLDLKVDATIGFVSLGMSQPIDLSTLNNKTVQVSYQAFGSNTWVPVPVSLGYSAGNHAIVVTPGNFKPDGVHVQPNGTYVVGILPGLRSTPATGSQTLSGNYYFSYTDHTGWGSPGHFPITAVSLPGDRPASPYTDNSRAPVSYVSSSGSIITDQYMQLDPKSVNNTNVKLYHLNSDGSRGSEVPVKVTYDAQIPSIYTIPLVALTKGSYVWVEQNTVNFAGNRQKTAVYLNFTRSSDEPAPGFNVGQAVNVNWTYPADGTGESVTDLSSIGFNQPIDATTLTTNSIKLQKNVNGTWTSVPIAITYNAGTYVARLTPTSGIQAQGSQYRIVVNADLAHPIKGTTPSGNPPIMSVTRMFSFKLLSDPNAPVIDAPHWGSFPAPGSVISNYPAALLVVLNKWNGYQSGNINNKTFQLYAVNSSGTIISGPIDNGRLQVAWNPRSSYAVITLPDVSLGDGRYVIVAHAANGTPGVGVIDLAGNVQKLDFRPGPFTITGTGRPQTLS